MARRSSAIVAGVSIVSAAALIVAKMVALDWVGSKIQSRYRRR